MPRRQNSAHIVEGTLKGKTLRRLAYEIRRSSIFEDRLEYCITDLQSAYELTESEAKELQRILHCEECGREPWYKPF